jgi:tRNA dimethylallyltransferase
MDLKKLLIIVVGPTASGKSELAVKIARKVNGEIISADSRQIYKGLDIGSGKVEGQWELRNSKQVFMYKKIPHYLIDEASPRVQYSVARFQKQAQKIIDDILARGKTPIICGGTGHWIDAAVFDQNLPEVEPDLELRKELEKLSVEQLFTKLRKLDPDRAASIDAKNPRRLIRALEIVVSTGKPVPKQKSLSKYNAIWIGINPDKEILNVKIAKRLRERLHEGMVEEVKNLHQNKLSWKKLESFGLEYKYIALFLQGKLSEQEMEEQLYTAIKQYAKRQMTWWKRNKNIHWSDNPTELMSLPILTGP